MKLVTQRDMVRNVYAQWEKQYPKGNKDNSPIHNNIREMLGKINLEEATAEEINNLIGNKDWTTGHCDECNSVTENYILFGESRGYLLCLDCARTIAKIIQ